MTRIEALAYLAGALWGALITWRVTLLWHDRRNAQIAAAKERHPVVFTSPRSEQWQEVPRIDADHARILAARRKHEADRIAKFGI